jgi:DNA repair protein RadC
MALPTPGKADDAWLQRLELRGDERVLQALDSGGFRERTGSIEALFVDHRCGLIGSQKIGTIVSIDPSRAAADILRLATNCQASGIVVATNDPTGAIARAPRCRKLTMDLYRKGEAIEVFLLDHFILTAAGWRRMFAFNGKKRN